MDDLIPFTETLGLEPLSYAYLDLPHEATPSTIEDRHL